MILSRIFISIILMVGFNIHKPTSDKNRITVYTIGDSTMANKPDPDINPERGWGQMLQALFTDQVIIDNRAVNGRSSRSFRTLKHWEQVYNKLNPGDYVFIQFGHNDGKVNDPSRYTNPHVSYRHNLINYVKETREKGATPVLFTSIVRRNFNSNGVLIDTHGDYTLVTRLVAQELNVVCIDLQYQTELLEESYGLEGSKSLHLHFSPEENKYIPNGIEDNTHLSIKGASLVAELAISELKKTNLGLVNNIK